MIKETVKIIKLMASEGMTLTNGETFGKTIYLGSNDNAERWQEITDADAEEARRSAQEQIQAQAKEWALQ